jgi:hypothetical protein
LEKAMLCLVPVENRARLASEAFDSLRAVLEQHTSLQRALAWFFGQIPPLAPADVIPQDEFSYDLLVPYPGGLCLSYDTS